jgi:hypothetical protein
MAWNDTLIRRHAAVADLRLLSNGTTVETAIDSSLQQAQASEGHAHVRMYGHGWRCTSGRGCWLHCQAFFDCDITPMDMLCARRCTRRTLQGVSHGWVDRHAVAASCQALPFPCCLDDGSRRHASNAKNSSHPSHPTQPSTQPSDNDLRSHHTSRGCPVAETWCVQESMCSF